MAAYIVTYDLIKEGQNYECLHKKLQAYGTHWHMQRSVWIVVTGKSSKEVRNDLLPCLDQNDKLFVAKLSGEAAWHGYGNKATEWLKSNI